ncbi:MAG: transcription-repair coupling factor [Candidatus Melainabacteria bacterium]|nr:MAG: transcription-repair coupling factor [Candidatus Melainabacteria bacterium]
MSFRNFSKFFQFKNDILSGKSFTVTGLTGFSRMLTLNEIKNLSNKKILFVTSDEQGALRYQNDFKKLFDIKADILPYQNLSFYETLQPDLYVYAEQMKILKSSPDFVIAPIKALCEKFASREFFRKNSLEFKIEDEVDTKKLAQTLINLGFKRTVTVSDIGEFSIRGDIIDIFSLSDNPVRIELWGDEIVDIRYFSNETQRSIEKIKQVSIQPVYKFLYSDNILPFECEDSGYFEGINVYQSYFNDNLVSVFDYLKNYIVVFDEMSEIFSKYELIEKNFDEQYLENLKLGLIYELKEKNHFSKDEFYSQVQGLQKVGLNNFLDFISDDILDLNSEGFAINGFENVVKELKKYPDYKITISTDFPKRVEEVLQVNGIENYEIIESISAKGSILHELKMILLTDRELFNKRSKEITQKRRSYYKEKQEFIESINDIKDGEYVVHSIHGIGIYKGLSRQETDGQYKDYLTIEYANNDRLYMPAEQINLLCRYRGAGTVKPALSRMGGSSWANTKANVKKEVEKIAYDLLRLYAKRKASKGIKFDADTPWQVEMEDAFEYTETPDQMKAINDVKADMESDIPMDRLVCGDVGFGKTEVAIRGVFKAIASGKQAAVIVPTTILAMQHFQTFEERFKPFGVNVRLLSRFQSSKEQKEILKQLATGECDVVIATHKLLQKNVVIKNLGLLVIDEEHRFGVRHKEKLKELKENIDVITMSATPIPRTLYMSLSGIKDMSLINTPPQNRLQVKTMVGEFNENMVKTAIMHELDRDGQVFYLYNRIESILQMQKKLQEIVPNARIRVGHGRLTESELEDIMTDFAAGEFDVLLCTTIIESGLDIPNANTMIIHDADKFGLAQLYQLRGRVGRSERQAYCYCFFDKKKLLTPEAVKRLNAIKEFTTLGSGYQIALRDIEIRGVGNILGTKQHGHMVNVGFDTYCQLLEETVNEIQGEKEKEQTPTITDINVTAFIPDDMTDSSEQKMIEYKRLADVKSNTELDYIYEEWKDRFAKIPKPVENLIKLIRIRLYATDAKISVIRETADGIRIYTPFCKAEYQIIKQNLPENILKYLKFVQAPKTCPDGNSIILLNNSHINFDEVFNILCDLFYYIRKVIHEYKNK